MKTIKNIKLTILVSLLCMGCSKNSAIQKGVELLKDTLTAAIIHPGVLNSEEDLNFMKSLISGHSHNPMEEGYEKMKASKYANLEYEAKAYEIVIVKGGGTNEMEDHFREDAISAYAHALSWIITGVEEHKDKSIEILNLWAKTAQKIIEPDYVTQPTLEASWAIPIWISAAEIIRFYENGAAKWSGTDIKDFESFVRMMLHTAGGKIAKAPNWHASRALARMSGGVFLDDKKIYQQGYDEAKAQIELIKPDGKPSENERDFGHCQYNVIATSQCAEIAFNQRDSTLYLLKLEGENESVKPLLFRQGEYFSREILGIPEEGGIDYSKNKKKHNPPYEMILARYQNDFKMEMNYTSQYVLQYNRPADASESHFVGWTTLTHAK